MISWLVSQFLPLSLLSLLLIVAHKVMLHKLGAINQYYLWSIIPLSLLLSFADVGGSDVIHNGEIYHYVINVQTQVQSISKPQWLTWFWLSGSVFFSVLILSFGYKANIDPSLEVIEGKNQLFGIPDALLLCRSDMVASPLICGLIKPRLVVPRHFFEQYSPKEQTLILQHEVCHFIRKDLYANLMALLVLIAFWFNPLIWMAYFRFRKDQELACDCQVLAKTDKQTKLIYSRALLKCTQPNGQYHFAQLLYGDKKIMTERILQIKTMRPVSKFISVLALMIGLVVSVSISFAGNAHEDKNIHANDGKVIGPNPVYRIEPKYPIQAAKDNVFGYVVLTFDVDPSGEVKNVSVVNSQPKGVFDQVSITALSQWRYQGSADGLKNSTVQLDYEVDVPKNIERIKVTK